MKLCDIGLLIMRVGLCIMFLIHGTPDLIGGPEKWLWLGKQMAHLGITFLPMMWGLAAACTKTFGAICLALGFQARIAAALLAFVMLVATTMHVSKGDSFRIYSHALSLMIVFTGLTFTGAGNLSIDARMRR